MFKYILKRLLLIVPLVFVISILVFLLIKFIPGDPVTVMFGRNPNPEQMERARTFYGLDKPLIQQYLTWAKNLINGDWGNSIQLNQPVLGSILERLPRTAALCILGLAVALIIAIPSGIACAKKPNSLRDITINSMNLLFISVPGFWFGILLILLLSVWLRVLPTSGYIEPGVDFVGWLKGMILPTFATAATFFASLSRMVRSSMLEVLDQDYISLARIKGNKNTRIYYIHALRNSLIPVVTMIGLQAGYLMGGTVVIEKVFSYPGMGLLLLTSINQRDYPLIQGIILVFSLIIVVVNLLTDITYMLIDPKIKFGYKKG